MSIATGQTVTSYFRPLNVVHSLSAAEAGSGEVVLQLFSDSTPTAEVGTHVNVTSISGVPRVLTKKLYSTSTGTIDITGTSFATGDVVNVLAFKYFV